MTNPYAIETKNVQFSYPDGHEVLKNINCDIKKGEKVALIGPNGAGKSTFMSLLNGVSLATQGTVKINGLLVEKTNLIAIRRQVGIVFQDPDDQLFCPTVFDDVAFGPLNLGLPKDEIKARVQEALQTVGLTGFEERSSFHLSFGERKRLALASVLSYQPDILVFDEPSTNMDPLNRRNLIKWLKESDRTILLCTHDLDIALEVCNRCLILSNGEFVADGNASDILYDKHLLEKNHLELPLALMTHELLYEKLRTGQMNAEERRIIETFLHAHRHAHGPDGQEHIHIHFHAHGEEHVHSHEVDDHLHEFGDSVLEVEEGAPIVAPPHHHHHDHEHEHGHSHDHDHDHPHPHPHPIGQVSGLEVDLSKVKIIKKKD